MLTLLRGKFYNSDGKPVPIEHGNKEQIQILERANALRSGVMMFGSTFMCLCGHSIVIAFSNGKRKRCEKCHQRYELFRYDDEVPCIKLV
jgi:hypothetical protein